MDGACSGLGVAHLAHAQSDRATRGRCATADGSMAVRHDCTNKLVRNAGTTARTHNLPG